MPNKETDPTATMMIVVDEKDPSTDPKTYQYIYVGNINDLPSDVLTESSIVNDLTTGGADKPLSAEQGRTLNSHVNYTTCGSNAGDQVKLISDDGFELSTHLRLLVMMTNTNTDSTPKFNINNTGAKDVWYNGSVASDINTWAAGEVLDVYYDGTKYVANTHGEAQFSTGEKIGDVGIDDEPTAGSNNLVKSEGVKIIDNNLNSVLNKTETVLLPSDLTDLNLYISTSADTWKQSIMNFSSKYIEVKKGDVINVIAKSNSIARIAFVDSIGNAGEVIEFSQGSLITIEQGKSYNVLVEKDCILWVYNAIDAYTFVFPENLTINKLSLCDRVVGEISDQTQLINPKENTLSKAVDVMALRTKLQDIDFAETSAQITVSEGGHYLNANTKTIVDSQGFINWKTATIQLNGERSVRFSGVDINSPNTQYYYGCGFVDSNETIFDTFLYTGNTQQGNLSKEYILDIPSNAVKFIFSIFQYPKAPEKGNYGDRLYAFLQTGETITDRIYDILSPLVVDFNNSTRTISYNGFSYVINNNLFNISQSSIDISNLTQNKTYYLNIKNNVVVVEDSIGINIAKFTVSSGIFRIKNIKTSQNVDYTINGIRYSSIESINHEYIKAILPDRSRNEKDVLFFDKNFYYDNSTRVCIIIPILKGEFFRIDLANPTIIGGNKLYYTIFQSAQPFALSSEDADIVYTSYASVESQIFTPINQTHSSYGVLSNSDGYIYILIKIGSTGTDTFSQELINEIKENTKIYVGDRDILKTDNTWNMLYIGDTFLPNQMSADGIGPEASNRVTMSFVTLIPDNAELLFVIPNNIQVFSRYGKFNEGSPFDKVISYMRTGSIISVPSNYQFVILCFFSSDATNPLTVEAFNTLLKNNEVLVYYRWSHKEKSIVETNINNETYIQAMFAPFANTSAINNNPDRLAKFIHVSDLHGDAIRCERVMQYAQYLGVDYVLATGDICMWKGEQGCQYVYDLAKKYNQRVFVCVGNHDSWGRYYTMSEMSDKVIMPCIISEECTYDTEVQYPTYYYKDIINYNIRLICLNQFDTNSRNGSTGTYYTQQQIDWFISTITSTPNGYGIIIIEHTPDVHINKDSEYSEFYQDTVYGEGIATTPNILTQIIDSFISRQTINTGVVQRNWNTGVDDTLNLIGDFTNVDSSVEFLFFANGHAHSDRIGYANGATNKILIANICSGNAQKHSTGPYVLDSQTDLPRRMYGVTQDAFNFYAVDRDNKKIRVARIGSNFTTNLTDRKYMNIPYTE